MDQKDEIKQKIDLVELIREYVALKAVGVNFQALCPFHREKTPSFVVSGERQIWKCFGCGKGGDAFSFVMEIEGLSFVEALRQLAPKAGVTLQRHNAREVSQRNRLLDCMEYAVAYYHRLLLEAPEAQAARDYLKARGLTEAVIEEFKIGYSRDSWDDLYNALRQKGFRDEDIFLSGLTVKKDKGLGYYNRFRGRIMFPLMDVTGNAVAFSARVSPEREAIEKQGKYINSPQSPLYDKSKMLFGLDKAKPAIREHDSVIVVEGQMDVISSYRVGVKQVVASSGTALSADQIKLIRRYTPNILMSFDMDSAGQAAAERGITAALRADMNVRVIQIPDGKDPDECVRTNPADWRAAIDAAVSVMDYYFTQTFTGRDLSDMGQKKAAAVKLLTIMVHIVNPIEQDTWLRQLAETLMVHEDSLRAVLRAQAGKEREAVVRRQSAPSAVIASGEVRTPVLTKPRTHAELLFDTLLALVLKYPMYLEHVINAITPEMVYEEARRAFYKMLVLYYSNSALSRTSFHRDDFLRWLGHNIKNEQHLAGMTDLVDTLLLLADRDFYDSEPYGAKVHLQHLIIKIKHAYFSAQLTHIGGELSAAERSGDHHAVSALMDRSTRVIHELKHLHT